MTYREKVSTDSTELTINNTTYLINIGVYHSSRYQIKCTLKRKRPFKIPNTTLNWSSDSKRDKSEVSDAVQNLVNWAADRAHDREDARALDITIDINVTE